MPEITVNGASDDLIEIGGAIREEFTLQDDEGGDLLAFSNGVVLRIRYTDDGVWRIEPLSFQPHDALTAKGKEAQRKLKATWNAANVAVVREASRSRFERLSVELGQIKLAAGCADCGYRDHTAALDFDHLEGTTKLANVSRLIRLRSWPVVLEEIAKCDVVCSNCHRIRTYNRARNA